MWLKASFALFAVSVAGATIMAFSYANDVPTVHLVELSGSVHNVSQVATHPALPTVKLITPQMILERTTSCAEMISPKDKIRCLNKRIKMKKEFLTQEKRKCDRLDGKSGKDQCFADLEIMRKGIRSV